MSQIPWWSNWLFITQDSRLLIWHTGITGYLRFQMFSAEVSYQVGEISLVWKYGTQKSEVWQLGVNPTFSDRTNKHFQTGPTNILVIYAYILSLIPILFPSCFGFYIFSHTFSQLFESLPWLIASSPQEMPEIIYPRLWKFYHVCWLYKVFFNQINPSNMLIFVELCWLYIYNVFTTSISIHMGWVKTLGLYSHP